MMARGSGSEATFERPSGLESPVPGDDPRPVRGESELLRTLLDKIPAMVAYWDSAQRCRLANRAYQRWFGVSPEWLLGRHISELLGPLYQLNLPYIERALRGEPQEFEREIPDPRGAAPRHSLANYIPDIADGVVRGFFALVTDISAIKRAELALRDSEERLRLAEAMSSGILSISADAIISIDEHQRITMFNEGAEGTFGYTRAEALGAPLDILIPERLRAEHRQHVAAFATGTKAARPMGTRVALILGLRKNGEEFPADAAISKLDVGGKRILTVALRDITEQKRIENEQRFLAEVGPLLATTLDYDETLTKIAELAVRDVADLCIIEIVEDDDEVRRLKVACRDPSKAWLCRLFTQIPIDRHGPSLMRSVLETRQPVFLQRPSAETIASLAQTEDHHRALRAAEIHSMLAVPLMVHGRLLGAIGFVSFTASRVYGPADIHLAEELAQRAALSIENARLYRSARGATQARDDVLGIVAHDLRNPLQGILWQASLLRTGREQPEHRSRQAAEAIERAATRMNRLIQDLLDVTRIQAGHVFVEPARILARQVVHDCVEAQQPLATSASIELRLDVAPELPEIWADRDRLLRVFENLIGNALKFTRPGGSITVGAAPRDGEVLFWVKDTGCGIAAEDVPHLFDRFWQATKAQQRGGAGLGLPIVKGVVEAHRGRIWVESTPGEGSSFFFTIPAVQRAEARRGERA